LHGFIHAVLLKKYQQILKPFTVTTRRWEKAVKQWFFSHDGYPFKISRTGFAQSWFFNSRFASIGTMPEHPKKQAARCTACAFQRHKESETPCLQVAWQGRRESFPRAVMQLPCASKLPRMHRAFATQLAFGSLVVCTIQSAPSALAF
jgi:hypothetical protein